MTPAVILAALAAAAPIAQDPRFKERVDVERVMLDARVLDGHGDARTGLKPADFRLKVDGKPVPVESAFWVDASTPYAEGLPPDEAAGQGALPSAPGRLIVFFFQKDLHPSRTPG